MKSIEAERIAADLYNKLERNSYPSCRGALSRLITSLIGNLALNQFKCKRGGYSLALTSIIKSNVRDIKMVVDKKILCMFTLLSLIVLNILDFIVTSVALKLGLAIELNPIIAVIINAYGMKGLLIIKEISVICLLCLLCVNKVFSVIYRNRWLTGLLGVVTISYFIIVIYGIIGLMLSGV